MQKIIFLHIAKTAGSSLVSIIQNQYKTEEICYINKIKKKSDLLNFSLKNPEKINVVAGHHLFGVHRLFKEEVKYITLLRNPINRIVSLYFFLKRTPQNKRYKKINCEKITLKDFVLNDNFFRGVFNGQTKRFAGLRIRADKEKITLDTYKKAIENLDKHFLVAGLTERFDESILLMKNELNWSYPVYVKRNAAKKNEKPNEIPDEIKQLIAERNVYDIKLYNYVKENFEKKIEQNKEKIEKQLKKLALLNTLFKPYKMSKEITKSAFQKIYHKLK